MFRLNSSVHARTIWTIVAVNVWERYAFYTMLTLLPLFLTAGKDRGGLDWEQADALAFFGAYLGIVWSSPFLGGIITDRWLGASRALVIGTSVLLLGHLVLGLPYLLPILADRISGTDISSLLVSSPLPDGRFLGRDTLEAAMKQMGADDAAARWAAGTHIAVTWSLYAAVALIAIGNGLFKPTITLLLGRLDYANDGERTAAYSQLYMGRNLGSVLAGLVAGWLGARFGWHLAFTTAAIGMVVALVTLGAKWSTFKPLLARDDPARDQDVPAAARHPIGPGLLLGFAGLLAAMLLYSVAYDQSSGLGLLFVEAEIERTIFGFLIPSAWIISINPLLIILLTPLYAAAWRNEQSFLARLNTFESYGLGFTLTAAAFGCFMVAAMQIAASSPAGWPLIAFAILLLTLGELCIAPVGEAVIAKWAPPGRQTIVMGTWFAASGIGSWLSGLVGARATDLGYVAVFTGVTLGALGAGLVLFAVGRFSR